MLDQYFSNFEKSIKNIPLTNPFNYNDGTIGIYMRGELGSNKKPRIFPELPQQLSSVFQLMELFYLAILFIKVFICITPRWKGHRMVHIGVTGLVVRKLHCLIERLVDGSMKITRPESFACDNVSSHLEDVFFRLSSENNRFRLPNPKLNSLHSTD